MMSVSQTMPRAAVFALLTNFDAWFVQISSPAANTRLVVPLPLPGSETMTAVHQSKPEVGSMHVRVCADNVCSLQVWH